MNDWIHQPIDRHPPRVNEPGWRRDVPRHVGRRWHLVAILPGTSGFSYAACGLSWPTPRSMPPASTVDQDDATEPRDLLRCDACQVVSRLRS